MGYHWGTNTRYSRKCGLVKDIPIAAGAGDYTASCLGAGLTRPGLCIDVTGTASVLAVSTTDITPDKKYKTLLYVKSIVPELWQVGAYINGGGLCLRLFHDEFSKYEKERAREINVDPYKLLDEEASKVPEGSEGLIFIPHLGGRAYSNQPNIKGVWFGFTWKHTTGHFFRSIMEGVAYEYYYYMRVAKSLFKDLRFEEAREIGGGSKSKTWAQIKADVLNIPYVLLNKEEYAALALAAIGGYAVGAIKNCK
jgi:xylulokinase